MAKSSFEVYIVHLDDAFSKYSDLSKQLQDAKREGVDHTEFSLLSLEYSNALQNYRRLCSEFGEYIYFNAERYRIVEDAVDGQD